MKDQLINIVFYIVSFLVSSYLFLFVIPIYIYIAYLKRFNKREYRSLQRNFEKKERVEKEMRQMKIEEKLQKEFEEKYRKLR